MFYSIVSVLALILNFIINRETLRNLRSRSIRKNTQKSLLSYALFLTAANCYFIADVAWGLLYEYHHVEALFPVLYIDCFLYFLFMFFTMMTWMRYVVIYLDRKSRYTKIHLWVVWMLFAIGLIDLIINTFHPFIFSFNDQHEYITEMGRHIAFILQIVIYMAITICVFCVARKSTSRKKTRYRAVGFTCLVMDLFMILQILDPNYPFYAMGLIIGISVIHSYVEAGEMKEKEIYDHIATSLAEDYEAMYYINMETGEFREFSTSPEYATMNVPEEGRDFYAETRVNIEKCVHPDDREFAQSLHYKETMLKNLEGKKSYSYKYRLMVGGQARFYQFTVMRANDDKHLVLYAKDIEDEITAENVRLENQKKHATFSQIAESLATNYDVIYYVDAENSSYISYECRNVYGKLDMQKSGDDFFADARNDIATIVNESDRELALGFVNRDYIISALKDKKRCSIDYRVVAFEQNHYVRMTVRKTSDGTHFIIGIENIDAEVKKEQQHLKALNTEKELARRDELTGVKNKTAYKELEKSVQADIDGELETPPFALVVCDANNLKKINDTEGHAVGDEYIKKSAMLLCEIFDHSPVFRVGGDEFVVFLKDSDYSNRKKLMKQLYSQVHQNAQSGSGPIIASGMAEYESGTDSLVSQIFDRADKQMYENKRELKEN